MNMKNNAKVFIGAGAAALAAAALAAAILKTAGGNLDVVGGASIGAFNTILQTIPERVNVDETTGGFALTAPDAMARFIWSGDFSKSAPRDVMLEFDAKPFTDAGLDAGKLPGNYDVRGDTLTVGAKLGGDASAYGAVSAPLAAYERIADKYGGVINFHASLDHYGVMLGDGNMFEWARDLSKNSATGEEQDKDIVFVLNPEPLIAAGADPYGVEGWAYAQVPTDDGDVWKFLKPFNLK
jgi:hypothetical protein